MRTTQNKRLITTSKLQKDLHLSSNENNNSYRVTFKKHLKLYEPNTTLYLKKSL